MKRTGIREARQSLSTLIDAVKKGHEVEITERGRPVVRLVAAARPKGRPFPSLAKFRRQWRKIDGRNLEPALSQAIQEGREDSL